MKSLHTIHILFKNVMFSIGKLESNSFQKYLVALQIGYDIIPNLIDQYIRMSESTSRKSL